MMPNFPAGPMPEEFREAADRSRATNIADESANYVKAAGIQPVTEDNSAPPQDVTASTGREAAALVKSDNSPDDNDIEPFHIPGSAEDIHVTGETGLGPSG